MLKKIFQSSTGEGLAKRWQSFFTGVIPLLVFLSSAFGWNLVETDFSELNGIIVVIISTAVALWQAVEHAQGWFRRNKAKALGLGKFYKIIKNPDSE